MVTTRSKSKFPGGSEAMGLIAIVVPDRVIKLETAFGNGFVKLFTIA
jgi:hypothetical protein